MIKFFRKIRYDLMDKNKTGKYLKYAIGEILLVVVGILIAVGINSRYNDSQNEEKIRTILTQVQQELLTDITDAKRIFNFYIEKDAMSRRIMNDSVTVAHYKENPGNIIINYNYVSFSNKKGGYQRLLNNLENLPERYKCLLPHFNTLYVELQNDVDDYNTQIKKTVYNAIDDKMESNPKLTDYERGKYPEEAAEYFVNDPFLKNKTSKFINDLGNITQAANDYRIESIVLFNKIDSLLGNKVTDYPDLLSTLPKKEIIGPYLGVYKRVGGTMDYDIPEMSYGMEEGLLINYDPKAATNELYWENDMYFFEKEDTFIHKFYTNDKGQHAVEQSNGLDNLIFVLKIDL